MGSIWNSWHTIVKHYWKNNPSSANSTAAEEECRVKESEVEISVAPHYCRIVGTTYYVIVTSAYLPRTAPASRQDLIMFLKRRRHVQIWNVIWIFWF